MDLIDTRRWWQLEGCQITEDDSANTHDVASAKIDELIAEVERLMVERNKYRSALKRIAVHLELPCDKRDDGVLEQIVSEVIK